MRGKCFLLTLCLVFVGSVRAEITADEQRLVAQSIRWCSTKASAATSATWGGLLVSSVGIPAGLLLTSAGMNNPVGATNREAISATLVFAAGAVAGANASYVLFFGDDFRTLGALAGELGFGVDGVVTKSFLARCLNSNSEAICTKVIENLRTSSRAGTMCSGW